MRERLQWHNSNALSILHTDLVDSANGATSEPRCMREMMVNHNELVTIQIMSVMLPSCQLPRLNSSRHIKNFTSLVDGSEDTTPEPCCMSKMMVSMGELVRIQIMSVMLTTCQLPCLNSS